MEQLEGKKVFHAYGLDEEYITVVACYSRETTLR